MKVGVIAALTALTLAQGTAAQDAPKTAPPGSAAQPNIGPDWVRKPTVSELGKVYPSRAFLNDVDGNVRMTCKVNKNGELIDCFVQSESPAGYGFGQAALKLASKFRMKTHTRDGESVEGATITLPLPFRLR